MDWQQQFQWMIHWPLCATTLLPRIVPLVIVVKRNLFFTFFILWNRKISLEGFLFTTMKIYKRDSSFFQIRQCCLKNTLQLKLYRVFTNQILAEYPITKMCWLFSTIGNPSIDTILPFLLTKRYLQPAFLQCLNIRKNSAVCVTC